MVAAAGSSWEDFWADIDRLTSVISKSGAVNVNAADPRHLASATVEAYFRRVRPEAAALLDDEDELATLDASMQDLLTLSHGRNAKRSWVRVLRAVRRQRVPLSIQREKGLGRRERVADHGGSEPTAIERRIAETLSSFLPETAASYEQSIADLAAPDRVSYRGTAVELREVVREVLDYLAPDRDVEESSGFQLESGRSSPTMKQKARFVLRSRGVGASSRQASEQTVSLVDELTSSLVRLVYNPGSAATHSSPTRESVGSLKNYVDAVLAELLQAAGGE